MSDIIRLLPDHVANQIAAGEVVQRPASVVKELIENSIDAGATRIELIIKDAGRTLIQLVDNGKGMSLFDARMCFERHATSKISSADDLFNLNTKGFRGEALASIAAIAHVSLKTKRSEDELGTIIQIEGTEIVKQEPVSCANGANFEVRNLFYNVPARRNFLKSDQVEFKHILDEFERVALPHPEITFRLVHNDTEIYNLTSGPLRKRIVDIFGKNYNNFLVPVHELTDIVGLEGFVCKPEAARKSRGEQYLFVNNRFFKDTYFNHAISSAFDQLLATKLYPGYFLFLTVDPKRIDVNVHPTKTEIKFEDDKAIYSIIRSAVRLGLGKFNITPTLDFDNENEFDIPYDMKYQTPVEPVIKVDKTYNPFHVSSGNSGGGGSSFGGGLPKEKAHSPAMQQAGFGSAFGQQNWENTWESADEPEIPVQETVTQTQLIEEEPLQLTGPYIVKSSFIVGGNNHGLWVVHARRAYERLLYNELMQGFFINPLSSQQLIFPFEKQVSKQDQLAWDEHKMTLERIGFNWAWENQTLQLIGIPAILDETTVLPCVDKILEQLQMGTLDKGEVAHTVLSQLAFAGSMGFKIPTQQEAIAELLERWIAADEHQYTPGGKKVIGQITNEFLMQIM